ncbi:AraC family transcriptional regulator [Chelativorans sp. M5D2P16]|uniref:AraC family transcriptional regulator n=1 Tax=Chelativorans sp. M5D2P16 TaxID=3095678 RepID=UPI002ACB02D1|nr:AraC family transcriptional regulator [Chelativorans sp. M5D2P16]MDZ5699831.1 AraC family transcriptional regulator [Chelativorans sp. M5D2P16]
MKLAADDYPVYPSEARARPQPSRARPVLFEFTGDQTHGFVQSEHCEVVLTSDGCGWTSAYVSRQKEYPYRKSFAACPDTMVAFTLDGPIRVWRNVHGVADEKDMLPGSFGIVPAGAPFEAKLDRPLESVQVYIRQAIVEEVSVDLVKGDPDRLEIIPRFAALDPMLEQLAMGMCDAARDPVATSPLYVDHLATAFAAHLVRNHSSAAERPVRAASSHGLDPRQFARAVEFIEANLSKPLSLADLARDSKLSPGHFARLFKKSSGLTPYRYVMRRRIERAQRLLAETTMTVASIAFECGFADQMHLTQTFRRMTGTTPAAYRKECNR